MDEIKLDSPTLTFDVWDKKIHWVWFDQHSDSFLISNHKEIWALDASGGEFEHIYSNSENGRRGNSKFPKESLMNLVSEKVKGFEFIHLATYLDNDEPLGDIFMLLKDAASSRLNGALSVCHPLSVENSIFFKDDCYFFNEKKHKLSSYTHVHCAHPLSFSFFVGDNVGVVSWQKCDDSGITESVKIMDLERTIKEITISADGLNLFVASLGKISWFRFIEGEYSLIIDIECAVRHFIWEADSNLIVCMRDKVVSFEIDYVSIKMNEKSCLNTDFSIHQAAIDFIGGHILVIPQHYDEPMRFYEWGCRGGI